MQPHQQRVVDEKSELDERLGKLKLFFGTDVFAGLNNAEMELLQQQADTMQKYSDILALRVAAFQPKKAASHPDVPRPSNDELCNLRRKDIETN